MAHQMQHRYVDGQAPSHNERILTMGSPSDAPVTPTPQTATAQNLHDLRGGSTGQREPVGSTMGPRGSGNPGRIHTHADKKGPYGAMGVVGEQRNPSLFAEPAVSSDHLGRVPH